MSGFLNDNDQGQTKNMVLFMVVSVSIMLVWQSFTVPPPPPPGSEPAVASGEAASGTAEVAPVADVTEDTAADGSGDSAPTIAEAEALPPMTLRLSNHDVDITNVGGRLRGVSIREPDQYVPRDSILGVFPAADQTLLPLAIRISGLPDLRETSVYEIVDDGTEEGADGFYESVAMRWVSPDGSIEVTRRYAASDLAFGVGTQVEVRNLSATGRTFDGLTTSVYGEFSSEGGGMLDRSASVLEGICAGDFGTERRPARKIEELRGYGAGIEDVHFAGIDEQYFLTALVPTESTVVDTCGYEPVDASHMVTRLSTASFDVPAGETVTFDFMLFTGPKHTDYLSAFPGEITRSVDFGLFSFLALPIRYFLLLFQGWVINWGLAIIVLTVFIKIVLFPVTQKGYESMEKMKGVQPKLKIIQEKYASDRQKLAEEQMKLFKDEGVSPMSGCLPMLAQMPIYFALYRTIWGSAELYNAPFYGWVTDLSMPDPFFILPLGMGIVMFIQQRLMPQAVDNPQMKMVNRIMPIMFTVMMLFLPSGLVLYIFINMLLSIFQMLYIRKKFGTSAPAPAKG